MVKDKRTFILEFIPKIWKCRTANPRQKGTKKKVCSLVDGRISTSQILKIRVHPNLFLLVLKSKLLLFVLISQKNTQILSESTQIQNLFALGMRTGKLYFSKIFLEFFFLMRLRRNQKGFSYFLRTADQRTISLICPTV